MEQRRSINNSLKKDKKQTVSLKDHSPPILEPSTWKINVHSAFYQQIKDKQEKQEKQEKEKQHQQQLNDASQPELSSKSNSKSDEDFVQNNNQQNGEPEDESNDDTYDEYSNTDDDENEHKSSTFNNINRNSKSEAWQFKANIHHIIQGHQPSTRILTIESKKNANLVLTGGSEGNIRMWRIEYSKLRDLTQYTQHLGPIKNISFLKYTDQIASCCGEIHVWDSAKCETIRKFAPHTTSLSSSSSKSAKDLKLSRQHSRSHARDIDPALLATKTLKDRDRGHSQFDLHHHHHHHSIHNTTDKYTCMTPFNYCCLLAGNQKGRIEFLDINTRSCSYDWEILPHSAVYGSSHSYSYSHSHVSSSSHHHSASHHHSSSNSNIGGSSRDHQSSSSSSTQRHVTAIAVRNNQREVAVGLSDGQIVILDLRNGFIVESFHEFNYEIHKLYWSTDNILIALCRDQGLYVFNCNQISRLYLQSCQKFDKYPRNKLFMLDDYKSILSSSSKIKEKTIGYNWK